MSTQKRTRGWNLEINVFVRSTVFKQQFYCLFLQIMGGGCTIGCFLWISDPIRCLKDQLYARFSFNNCRSFVNSLIHLVRSYLVMVFTYVKVALVKLRKTRSRVMQLHISYQVNGHQENYGHHRRKFRQLARDSSCCQKDFVQELYSRYVSRITNSCIFKNLIRNKMFTATFVASCRKYFRCLKLYLKLIGQELLMIIIPFEKPKIEVHIYDRATISGFALREFTKK